MACYLGAEHAEVDYGLPTEEVFIRARKSILLRDPQRLLYGHSCQLHLPSWVPDLIQRTELSEFAENLYSAGGTDRDFVLHVDSFAADSRSLMLHGFVFEVVSEGYPPDPRYVLPAVDQITGLETSFIPNAEPSTPYGDYNARRQAFWRTLIANRRCPGLKAELGAPMEWPAKDNGVLYEVYVGRAEPLRRLEGGVDPRATSRAFADEFTTSLALASHSRTIFLTQSRYFGIGPNSMKPGDLVVIVPGLWMPLILRHRECEGRYQMIGPAYVHGIMKGEFIEELLEYGRLDHPETFEID